MWLYSNGFAGVTTIETNQRWPNTLLVGSYDETVQAWDIRKPSESLSSISLGNYEKRRYKMTVCTGGGIWRIRSSPYDNYLAVAAMRGYFHLLEFDGASLSLLATHDKVSE